MNLCDYDELRELLSRHGFRFSRSMGQNFLIDPEIPRAIAEASGAGEENGVLEIGPGVGVLTRELAARAGRVAAVELDRSLLPVLAETLGQCPNTEVVSGDVLRMDLTALAAEKFPGLAPMVCANLPYNITSPVLTKLARSACFSSFTVMIQKEAAQRLCADPGSGEGGFLPLLLHYRFVLEPLFDVPPECFFPRPQVTSSVLRCTRRPHGAVEVEDEALFVRVLRGAFALRRKTLVNSLASFFPELGKDALRQAVVSCSLREDVRGEQLTLEDFAALARALRV